MAGAARRHRPAGPRRRPHQRPCRHRTRRRRLRDCADRGVAVHLVRPSPGRDADAVKAFTKVVEGTRGITVHRRRFGVRLVVRDDTLQLGSSPRWGGPPPAPRAPALPVSSGYGCTAPGLSTELLSRLGVEQEPHRASPQQESGRPVTPVTDGATAAYGALVTVRQADAEGRYSEALTGILRDLDDPWRVLEVWEERRVSATDLCRGAATLLRLGERVPPVHRRRWCRWLVADAGEGMPFSRPRWSGACCPTTASR